MYNRWLPKIEVKDDAMKLAKQGSIGVLLFSAMNVMGVLLSYFANKSAIDLRAINAQEIQEHLIGALIIIPLLFFFAWRVYKGKGWFIAGFVLAWFILEISIKIMGGSANVGWIFFYIAVAIMIFNGLRGCWWLRQQTAVDKNI